MKTKTTTNGTQQTTTTPKTGKPDVGKQTNGSTKKAKIDPNVLKDFEADVSTVASLAEDVLKTSTHSKAVELSKDLQYLIKKVERQATVIGTEQVNEQVTTAREVAQQAITFAYDEDNFVKQERVEAIEQQSGQKLTLENHIAKIRLQTKHVERLDFLKETGQTVENLNFKPDHYYKPELRMTDGRNEFTTDKLWILEIIQKVLLTEIDTKIAETIEAMQQS